MQRDARLTEPQFVLGVDPGKATGVALYNRHLLPDDPKFGHFVQQWSSDVPTFVDWAWEAIPALAVTGVYVACERFDITPTTARLGREKENWSIEQAGVLRHLCRRHGQEFVLQDRATPKKMASNEHLRSVGWYVKGPDHVNDATRHVVVALARRFKQPPPWVS